MISNSGEIPMNWVETELGNLIQPSKEKVDPKSIEDIVYLGLEHIESQTGQIIGKGVSSDVRSTKATFKKGDLLYGKLRPYLNKVYLSEIDGICSTDILVFPKSKNLLNNYIAYRFLSDDFVRYANDNSTGVQHPRIKFDALSKFIVLIPPLNEQRRIVAKIEELTAHSKRARAALDDVPKLIEQFKQSVLAAAFRGDLTADWREKNPDVEPAEKLLERIRAERRSLWEEDELAKMLAKGKEPKNNKWKKKYKSAESIEEELPLLPSGWHWRKVEELVSDQPRSLQSGPFGSNLKHDEFQSMGVLAIGIDNVKEGRFSSGRQNRISNEKYQELKKYEARPLDVLITVMATVGRCCVVPVDIETAIITKHVYRATPEKRLIDSYFFMNALRGSEAILAQIDSKIRGQTRPGINGRILRNLIIPVPPKAEQEAILNIISQLLKRTEYFDSVLEDASTSCEQLDQSILSKAFRGELVPQDPNDEPASVLLERIRAERKKLEAAKKKKKRSPRKRAK